MVAGVPPPQHWCARQQISPVKRARASTHTQNVTHWGLSSKNGTHIIFNPSTGEMYAEKVRQKEKLESMAMRDAAMAHGRWGVLR